MCGGVELDSLAEALWIARYDYQPSWKIAEHKHEYFQMIYFISGSGSVCLEDREFRIKPRSSLLVKPYSIHALRPSSLLKTLDLKFLVKDRRLHESLSRASSFLEEVEPRVSDLLERIRHEGEDRGYLYREMCNVFLHQLLLQYLRSDREPGKICVKNELDQEVSSDWIVKRVTRFIEAHYMEDYTVKEIAHAVGRSDHQIRQHFKDVLGISPRRYLFQLRIQKAKELVESSDYSFKEIADRVGFKNVHHFTRAFREVSGETPGICRRKYQAGICKDVFIDPEFVQTNWIVREEHTPTAPI
jgi:AraC-like DNA-binding protein